MLIYLSTSSSSSLPSSSLPHSRHQEISRFVITTVHGPINELPTWITSWHISSWITIYIISQAEWKATSCRNRPICTMYSRRLNLLEKLLEVYQDSFEHQVGCESLVWLNWVPSKGWSPSRSACNYIPLHSTNYSTFLSSVDHHIWEFRNP